MPTLSQIASIRETPRNQAYGYISDFLNYLDKNALQQQFGYRNPVTGVISEALGIPAASRVANKLSYGEPITNVGKANVPLIPEDTAEAAMFAAPIAGKYAKTAGKMAGEAINNAMVYGEGNLAKITPQPMRIFVGPNSATFDKVNAVKAHEMEKAGVEPEKIWQETGTFRGPDKQWRQEISDEKSKLTLGQHTPDAYGAIEKKTFEGALEHPELQKAYPELNDIRFEHWPKEEFQGAFYEPHESRVTMGQKAMEEERGVALHELQHAIQQKEGFASGGSPKTVLNDWYQGINSELSSLVKQMDALPEWERKFDTRKQKQYQALRSKYDELMTQKLDNPPNAEDAYHRLAGEAEARAVQERLRMTPEQRKQTFPLKSYDVPIKDLIFQYK
jgi:hypothetical protein